MACESPLGALSYEEILALLWIAAMPGVVAYYMWNRAVALLGSRTVAPFSNLLPVFVAILGYVILGERITIGDIMGGSLIITGSTTTLTMRASRQMREGG